MDEGGVRNGEQTNSIRWSSHCTYQAFEDMTVVPCLLESPTSAQRTGRRAPDRGHAQQEWAADDISDGESVWSVEVHPPESRARRLSAKFEPIGIPTQHVLRDPLVEYGPELREPKL